MVGNFDGLATSAGSCRSGHSRSRPTVDNWAIIGSTSDEHLRVDGFGTDSTTNTLSYSAYKDDWTAASIPTPPGLSAP